ncbi:MAG: hypothetical protein KDB65_10670 [Calditrichaeota bacterium]|nr:hypothetical protein [Calditrichota bacterium]
MSTQNRTVLLSEEVGADLSSYAYRAVKHDTDQQLILPTADGQACCGFLTDAVEHATAAGLAVEYVPINAGGTCKAVAGEAIDEGDLLYVQANTGKLIKTGLTTADYVIAMARTAASGDGAVFEVYPLIYKLYG